MVTKSKDRQANEQTKRRAKVGKLQINKETIKDLTPDKQKQLRGGQIIKGRAIQPEETRFITCSCQSPC